MATEQQWADARKMLTEIGWPAGELEHRSAEAVKDFQEGFAFGKLVADAVPGPLTLSAMEESVRLGGACSQHFKFSEFASRGNGWIKVQRSLVRGLEHARAAGGGKPIKIASGYRDPAHNDFVGGTPDSQHLAGFAADCVLPVVTEVRKWAIFSGIGAHEGSGTVSHVDTRTSHNVKDPTMWMYLRDAGIAQVPRRWINKIAGRNMEELPDWAVPKNSRYRTDADVEATGTSDRGKSGRLAVIGQPGPDAVGIDGDVAMCMEVVRDARMAEASTPEHVKRILNVCAGQDLTQAQTAYVLATALHESRMGWWMEEHADGSAYEGRSDLGNTQKGDGKFFKGRGYVQLTGRRNYTEWNQRLFKLGHEVDLLNDPDVVKRPGIAAVILVRGMMQGSFTGRMLPRYVNPQDIDFSAARQVVNGSDRASDIAAYAEQFQAALDRP